MTGPHFLKVPCWLGDISIALVCLLLSGLGVAQQTAPNMDVHTGEIVERGKFVLHKFAQAIGEETYEIRKSGRSFQLASNFEFTDRGYAVPLTAKLNFDSEFTPEEFEIKGKNARFNPIDDFVIVDGSNVHIRQDRSEKNERRPRQFFMISGYAPAAVQMMLLRYWRAHGSPNRLRIFPTGEVNIEHRGSDRVEIGSKPISLERYLISGLIWGGEAVWLDSKKQLVAVISIDAEFDHFEALRDGYEAALPVLLASAGKDEMAALADIAQTFPGRRTGKLALVGGTLVDGTGGEPISDAAVIIDGDRIAAAGPRAQITIPVDATLIDTSGKTILPGLWDMHAHFEQVEWGPIYLAAGATTVRDCGNEFEFIVAVRDAIRSGRGLGPRLLLAGLVDGTSPKALGIQRVDSPVEAQGWVNRYHDAGFQQMKIYSSMTRENVEAVATAAHQLGMTVTGHVPNSMNLFQAVEAGMDQINHVHFVAKAMVPEGIPENFSWEQAEERFATIDVNSPQATKAIDFLKAHSIVVDPTVALQELGTAGPGRPFESFEPGVMKVAPELAAQYVTPTGVEPTQQTRIAVLQHYLQIIGALHRAGVPIVTGTDQSVPGYSLYREIELYVDAGFTPMEAVKAATIVPAQAMGLSTDLGTVERGKKADLIVLGANPLESIHNIRTVEKVVSGGTLYDSASLWKSVGFKP